MRKFISAFMLFLPLAMQADFFPETTESSVGAVSQNKITLTKSLSAKGMSGIIVHNYGSDLKAITSYFVYDGGGGGTLIAYEPIMHESLPAIKSKVSPHDKVIGGYLYRNVLLLAPDAQTYTKITSASAKNWIHPDLYAMFLSKEKEQYPTKDNLAKFASEYQVGLIYIVKRGKAELYDPVSKRTISQMPMGALPAKGQFPFYMRLDKIEGGWFSKDTKGEYYQSIGAIQ
jgi:hypothetical protein